MKKTNETIRKQLTEEELKEVTAGIGPFSPHPRRHRTDPDVILDKPKDGGATGGW